MARTIGNKKRMYAATAAVRKNLCRLSEMLLAENTELFLKENMTMGDKRQYEKTSRTIDRLEEILDYINDLEF